MGVIMRGDAANISPGKVNAPPIAEVLKVKVVAVGVAKIVKGIPILLVAVVSEPVLSKINQSPTFRLWAAGEDPVTDAVTTPAAVAVPPVIGALENLEAMKVEEVGTLAT